MANVFVHNTKFHHQRCGLQFSNASFEGNWIIGIAILSCLCFCCVILCIALKKFYKSNVSVKDYTFFYYILLHKYIDLESLNTKELITIILKRTSQRLYKDKLINIKQFKNICVINKLNGSYFVLTKNGERFSNIIFSMNVLSYERSSLPNSSHSNSLTRSTPTINNLENKLITKPQLFKNRSLSPRNIKNNSEKHFSSGATYCGTNNEVDAVLSPKDSYIPSKLQIAQQTQQEILYIFNDMISICRKELKHKEIYSLNINDNFIEIGTNKSSIIYQNDINDLKKAKVFILKSEYIQTEQSQVACHVIAPDHDHKGFPKPQNKCNISENEFIGEKCTNDISREVIYSVSHCYSNARFAHMSAIQKLSNHPLQNSLYILDKTGVAPSTNITQLQSNTY